MSISVPYFALCSVPVRHTLSRAFLPPKFYMFQSSFALLSSARVFVITREPSTLRRYYSRDTHLLLFCLYLCIFVPNSVVAKAKNQTILYNAPKRHFVIRSEYYVLTWDGAERAVSPAAMQPEG